jgi:CRP-like cAMP-binding protein
MSPADASLFLAAMSLRPLTEHEPLFRAGQVGDGLFVILEGSVSLYRKNAKGGEREVAALERNEVLGEMDLISDRPHTTSAKGRTAGRVLFLPKGTFQDLLRRGNPGAASMVVYFARMLASRLDRNNQRMMELLDRGSEPRPPSEFAEFKRRLLKEWSF